MIDQTRFLDKEKGTRGNCLQACLASVLGLPLDAVPDFTLAHPADWMDDMKAFVAWGGYEWNFGAPEEVPPGMLYIVNGQTKRGTRHSTVWRDGVMVHDPHPDKSGLEAQDGNVWWFSRITPSSTREPKSAVNDVIYWQAFLEWNRAQPEPLVNIGAEYAVAQVAARLWKQSQADGTPSAIAFTDEQRALLSTASLHLKTWATSKNKDPYMNTLEVADRLHALAFPNATDSGGANGR